MPALTHILAAAFVLAVVLIHAAWRRWYQTPPACESCGRYYCQGECVQEVQEQQQPCDDIAVWERACEGIDSKMEGN